MTNDIPDPVFNLRYASVISGLNATLWRRISYVTRALSFLSLTATIAALSSMNTTVAFILGAVFTIAQCLETILDPLKKAAGYDFSAKMYATVLTKRFELDEVALTTAYLQACSEDKMPEFEGTRSIAYNRVADEQGHVGFKRLPEHWFVRLFV